MVYGHGSEYEPNFVLQREVEEAERRELDAKEAEWERTHLNVITEDNYTEYWARGFRIINDLPLTGDEKEDDTNLGVARLDYGDDNVYTGDAYYADEGQPLSHKPGKTIYIRPEGLEHYERVLAERELDTSPDAS
jgi:hypothetical protein